MTGSYCRDLKGEKGQCNHSDIKDIVFAEVLELLWETVKRSKSPVAL